MQQPDGTLKSCSEADRDKYPDKTFTVGEQLKVKGGYFQVHRFTDKMLILRGVPPGEREDDVL